MCLEWAFVQLLMLLKIHPQGTFWGLDHGIRYWSELTVAKNKSLETVWKIMGNPGNHDLTLVLFLRAVLPWTNFLPFQSLHFLLLEEIRADWCFQRCYFHDLFHIQVLPISTCNSYILSTIGFQGTICFSLILNSNIYELMQFHVPFLHFSPTELK